MPRPRSSFRWLRILIAAVLAEAIPILLLVALVAVFGPKEQTAAQAYAEHLGQWVGPLGGALMCFLAAWWVNLWRTHTCVPCWQSCQHYVPAKTERRDESRRGRHECPRHHVLHGFIVGVLAALLDIAILIATGAAFQWLFVASNLGRILAGLLGGWMASRADYMK